MKILEKLQALLADSKMRIVMILFIVLLVGGTVTGIVFAIRYMTGPLGSEGGAALRDAPSITSIVGGWHNEVSPEYRRTQEQFNREQKEKAIQKGTSAMPSLIDSKMLPAGADPTKFGEGTGFQHLKLSQEQEGQAKSVGDMTMGTVLCGDPATVMGTLNANGEIKDASGKVLCKIQSTQQQTAVGTLVYDAQGNVIGTVGPDGSVRDKNGKVIGSMDVDGIVHDKDGKMIGKAKSVPSGTLVYDAQGNIIGTVGPDGVVRDASGRVVGRVGADGIVRDAAGNIIGKAGVGSSGALIY
ncbi:MAG: hypothetical protein ACNA7Y_03085, partial [Gammaproteobacteria bacterium]